MQTDKVFQRNQLLVVEKTVNGSYKDIHNHKITKQVNACVKPATAEELFCVAGPSSYLDHDATLDQVCIMGFFVVESEPWAARLQYYINFSSACKSDGSFGHHHIMMHDACRCSIESNGTYEFSTIESRDLILYGAGRYMTPLATNLYLLGN